MHTQALLLDAPSLPLPDLCRPAVKPAAIAATPHWTVRQFYERFFRPNYLEARRRRPGTIKLYEQVVRLWERFSPNPSLCLLDQETCRDFVERLRDLPGLNQPNLSDNTVRKLCTHLQLILDYSGPKTRRHRSSAQLIIDVPYLERPEKVQNPPDGDFTLEEIGLWMGACRLARPTSNLGNHNPRVVGSTPTAATARGAPWGR